MNETLQIPKTVTSETLQGHVLDIPETYLLELHLENPSGTPQGCHFIQQHTKDVNGTSLGYPHVVRFFAFLYLNIFSTNSFEVL